MIERRAWWIVLGLAIWGGALRLEKLEHWWLNPDEGIYHTVATAPADEADRIIERNAHPPLYYRSLRLLARLSPDVTALRLPSVVAGTLLIPLLFLLGRTLAEWRTGLVASALVAFSPGATMLSQMMRPYMVQAAFLALALWALARWWQSGRRAYLATYGAASSVALFLHYSTLVVFAALGLSVAVLLMRRRLEASRARDLVVTNLLPLACGIYLFATHLAPQVIGSDMQRVAQNTWLREQFIAEPGQAAHNYRGVCLYLFGKPFGTVASILFPIGIVAALRTRKTLLGLLPVAALVCAVLLSIAGQFPFGRSRHSIYLIVLLAPPTGYAVSFLLTRRLRVYRILGATSLVLLAVTAGRGTVGGLEMAIRGLDRELWIPRSEVEAVAAFVESDPEGILLVDRWHLYMLRPLWRYEKSMRRPLGSDGLWTLGDGRLRIVLTPFLRLTAKREERGREKHLEEVLTSLDEVFELSSSHVWIVDGRWGTTVSSDVPETLVCETVGGADYAVVRLKVQAYRDYLAAR